MRFHNILSLAEKYMFFIATFTKNSNNVLSYSYGPAGSLLLENIKSEWLHANVVTRDYSVFLFCQPNTNTHHYTSYHKYVNIRDLCNKQLPFGMADISNLNVPEPRNTTYGDVTETNYFTPLNKTCLSSEMYIVPCDGNHYFMHWQRQRKLWWKKISHCPSRFSLGEMYKTVDGRTAVNILAQFPWGNEVLETISISQFKENHQLDLHAHHGKKSVLPVIIKNTMDLETAVVGLLCDAYEETENHLPVLRIHRKLAPYKCTTCVSVTESSIKNEVSILAFSLTKQLRKSGVPTISLPNLSEMPLSSQVHGNDERGIPYTVTVDSASLKTGIVSVRDRDTTLNEEVHISELVDYMKQLIK